MVDGHDCPGRVTRRGQPLAAAVVLAARRLAGLHLRLASVLLGEHLPPLRRCGRLAACWAGCVPPWVR
jgi:hypothetical protein